MANKTHANTNIRMSQSTRELFDQIFEESGSNSKGEFIALLLDRYDNPPTGKTIEKIVEVEKPVEVEKVVEVEKLVEVEKQLQANQLILSLSDAELFALRETILSFNDFAERQNKVIDSFAPENKTWMDSRDMYNPEIYQMWRRFEPICEDMTDQEREAVIKLNIPSCLFNSFLYLFFMPDQRWYINKSLVTPQIIREYIITNQEKSDPAIEENDLRA